MRKLVLGTIEQLDIHVQDDQGVLTTLDGTAPAFDVYFQDNTEVVTSQSANNVGMTAYCLINTTTWTEGRYRLYLHFTNAPEVPKLGPYHFEVINP